MGIFKKPSLRLYWSTDSILKPPFFPAVMGGDRYFQILRYLHFSDNQDEVKDKDSPGHDKLFTIRKLSDLLLDLLLHTDVYSPERNLAVDETLVKFKGKVLFSQFIPIKPGRFGIKCFTLAESSSGYGLVSKVHILARKMVLFKQTLEEGQLSPSWSHFWTRAMQCIWKIGKLLHFSAIY